MNGLFNLVAFRYETVRPRLTDSIDYTDTVLVLSHYVIVIVLYTATIACLWPPAISPSGYSFFAS